MAKEKAVQRPTTAKEARSLSLFNDDGTSALDSTRYNPKALTDTDRSRIIELGNKFAEKVGGIWFLISGRFDSADTPSTEEQVRDSLCAVLGYPEHRESKSDREINVLLDSPGGSLDSAYTTSLYLSAFSRNITVYVPQKAKSASTLLAVGAKKVVLSPFGELGPLDTQLPDPRNPAKMVSALDCYQSVDYVRGFGSTTIIDVFEVLAKRTNRRVRVSELLEISTRFAIDAVDAMLGSVTALDFGGWGRSLRIGENYTKKLLEVKENEIDSESIEEISWRLVYGYTHHFFPIHYGEAKDIGLDVDYMDEEIYDGANEILEACEKRDFVGFISKHESEREQENTTELRKKKSAGAQQKLFIHDNSGHPLGDAGRG